MTTSKDVTKAVARTPAEKRHGIDVGPATGQVSPAAYWHKHGHLNSDDEARGTFRLAYQQGLDGMGTSIQGGWGWLRLDSLW